MYAVSQQIREICIFLSYNTLFFVDNSLSFSKEVNPLFAWTLIFALVGLIIGITMAVSKFQLHKKFYLYSFLGVTILLLLISKCSKPLKYNSSREIREEMLLSNLNKKNSYSICTYYINEFPEGKHITEIKLLQEGALWDSASVSKSSQVWKLYCDKFKSSEHYSQATINYDKILWNEISKVNTATAYANYLKDFPNGTYSKLAQMKLNKYLHVDKSKIVSGSDKKQEQALPDNSMNDSLTSNNDKPDNSYNDNINTSSDANNKLDLPGGINYIGENRNNLPNGNGIEIFPDKSSLKGFYINGKREGEFIYTKIDGSKEKWVFKNGNRIENSTNTTEAKTPLTSNYIGSRKNGTGPPQGEGKEIFPDGTTLSGYYLDGKRDGDFIYTGKDGTKEKQVFSNGTRIK